MHCRIANKEITRCNGEEGFMESRKVIEEDPQRYMHCSASGFLVSVPSY